MAIARALACDPKLVVGDEPTGNLDSQTGAAMLDLLASLNTAGTTVLYVTHDMSLATRARRIVTIKDGLCALRGSPSAADDYHRGSGNRSSRVPVTTNVSSSG